MIRRRIFLVDDDAELRKTLMDQLMHYREFELIEAGTANDALRQVRDTHVDLMILDVGLPDIDGFEVLRRLRARRSPTAVLVLTARDAVEDRVHGLDLGADDYLTKPFSVAEFEARVRALMRRNAPPETSVTAGALTVDVAAKRVRVNDRPVDLTPREWALLEIFLSRPGRVLSKDQIAERLIGFDEPLSANAVEVHVSRLRTKIEDAGVLIRTVRGFGYLWEGAHE